MLFDAQILNTVIIHKMLVRRKQFKIQILVFIMDANSCPFDCRASICNDQEINHQSRWPLIGLFVCRHCK